MANNSQKTLPRFKHKIQLEYEDFVVIDNLLSEVTDQTAKEMEVHVKVKQIIVHMKKRYAEKHPEGTNAG